MSGFYELYCRAHLFAVFKLCCLGVLNSPSIPPAFIVTLLDLASDHKSFTSAVRSVQSSLSGIPNVTDLFSNPRLVAPVFTLLGNGRSLLEDPNYSVWEVSPREVDFVVVVVQNRLESRFICTLIDKEREWTMMEVDPKQASSATVSPMARVVPGTSRAPKVPKPKFVKPTPFPVRTKASTSSPKNPERPLHSAIATLSVPRFVSEVSFLPPEQSTTKKKISIRKKSSPKKNDIR